MQRFWKSGAFLVLLGIAAACSLDARSHGPPIDPPAVTAATRATDKETAPAALRAAYVASVQKGAGPAYHVERAGTGLRATSHAQGLIADFASSGATLSPAASEKAWAFGVGATAWGCEGALTKVGPAEPEAEGNRVEYRREGLEEWYVNGPLGLEQGFTLKAPPACQPAGQRGVVIALGAMGELGAEVLEHGNGALLRDRSGKEVLRSTDLYVVDATGQRLPAALDAGREGLSIRIEDRGAVYPIEVDPVWSQQQKLIASDGAPGDSFGGSVALSGDTAIVGTRSNASATGAAYVFTRSGSSWTQQQELTASDTAVGDFYGVSVALSGDTAIVGALGKVAYTGAAYVFLRSGSSWIQQQKLTASDGAPDDSFGGSVALSGDTAIVGARGKASNTGAAYVFTRSGSSWTQQQTLTATGVSEDYFGTSVALSGDTAIVGAPDKASDTGAAYVFTRSGSSWTQQQRLTSGINTAGGNFGSSVAVSGDTVVVGSPIEALSSGAAYVFLQSLADNCTNVPCPPPGPCQEVGTCSPVSGACTYPPKNEGLPCDDGNACTQGDTCQMGACKSIENPCKAPDICHGNGDCDPATGVCGYPPKPCDPAPADAGPSPVVSGKLKNCQSDDDCKDRDGQGRCSEEHVCCDTPCDETCKSCRLPGSEGTCTEELHTDLKHDCGPSGYCLTTCESGQCVAFTGKRQCAPIECTDRTHVAEEAFCLGTETACPLDQRASFRCDPYACDQVQAACLTACATVKDCAPPLVCSPSHECVLAPGAAVGNDRACTFAPASPAGGDARGALAILALAGLSVARRRARRSGGPG
jgi:hypothetical protein